MLTGDNGTPTKPRSMQVRCVEDILPHWQEWDVPWSTPPRVVRELAGGSTNQSYLITAGNGQWVLRLNADKAATLGVDRKREAAIISRAAAAGIAPAVAYCSIDAGILITEFIDGQHWDAQALDDPERLTQLLDLVRSVHTLDIDTPPIDYVAHAERYWAALDAAKINIPLTLHHEREVLMEQREYNLLSTQFTHLCHHDLSPSNIIDRNGRLYLLDWEYAARGSRAFDYASLAIEWNLPVERLQKHVNIELAKASVAARQYQYICRLWVFLNERS